MHVNCFLSLLFSVGLSVVYPGEGDRFPYLTRTFIFGATNPGATVRVNNTSALVAPSGGWIAYVPVAPGQFDFHVVARQGGQSASFDRMVNISYPLQTLPPSPARIDPAVVPEPTDNLSLQPGDNVNLFIKASTQARVTAFIGQYEVTLVEAKTSTLIPSDKQRMLGGMSPSGAPVAGEYRGEFQIPPSASGKLSVRYVVRTADGSQATVTAKGIITVQPQGAFRVGSVVLTSRKKDIDARPYGVVEAAPDSDDWLLYPTAHIAFAVTAAEGAYYRVALGTNEQGWINKKSLVLAPPGTPRPHAALEDIILHDSARSGVVSIHMTGQAPYSVSESVAGPSLEVRIYGAMTRAQYVRYGQDGSNITQVRGSQLSGNIVALDIALRQHVLWGYHARWIGNDLELAIKKPPRFASAPASALKGLLVVIDPGHSPDSGSIGPLGTLERDVNLQIAQRFASHLERRGARAVLTRTANVPVGLYDRTDLAASLHADVLISIHNNALPDGVDPFTHHGYSVYYFQPQSLALARALHSAYAQDTNLPDYGLYYDNLALTRPTDEPAVLTESAFIMWPPEEMDLRDPAFQETLATTLTNGLETWAAAMRAREHT